MLHVSMADDAAKLLNLVKIEIFDERRRQWLTVILVLHSDECRVEEDHALVVDKVQLCPQLERTVRLSHLADLKTGSVAKETKLV